MRADGDAPGPLTSVRNAMRSDRVPVPAGPDRPCPVTIEQSAAWAVPITVHVATRPDTATEDDYVAGVDATVQVPAGATRASATVPIRTDSRCEPDEILHVELSRPTVGSIETHIGTLTIVEDCPV